MNTQEILAFVAETWAICEKAAPVMDARSPDDECPGCGEEPYVEAGLEYTRGDLCYACQAAVFNPLRTALPRALDIIDAQTVEIGELTAEVVALRKMREKWHAKSSLVEA
jgi:hypothetical protein